MRLRVFSVPAVGSPEAEAEVNAFLGSVRTVTMRTELVQDGAASFWAVAVTYFEKTARPQAAPSGGKIDCREVLAPDEFAVFAKLRELRKSIAETEKRPAYAVATNEHLAAMVKSGTRSLQAIGSLDGFGEARAAKYGERFLALLNGSPAGGAGIGVSTGPGAPTGRP